MIFKSSQAGMKHMKMKSVSRMDLRNAGMQLNARNICSGIVNGKCIDWAGINVPEVHIGAAILKMSNQMS